MSKTKTYYKNINGMQTPAYITNSRVIIILALRVCIDNYPLPQMHFLYLCQIMKFMDAAQFYKLKNNVTHLVHAQLTYVIYDAI